MGKPKNQVLEKTGTGEALSMQAAGAHGQSCLCSSVGTHELLTIFLLWFLCIFSPSVLDDSAKDSDSKKRVSGWAT